MARRTFLTFALTMVVGLWHAIPAQAQVTETSGTAVYVPVSVETVELPDGRTLARVRSVGYVMSDDSANPFRDSGQTCTGTNVGDVASGYCDAIDSDGDLYWIAWNNGPVNGSWHLIGGTGKFAGMSGGGTSTAHPASAEGQYRIDWNYTAD